MKISSVIICGAILLLLLPLNAGSVTFEYDGSGDWINKNSTWDSDTDTFVQVIDGLFTGADTLTLVNGMPGETETWYGNGAHTIILEEIAGYADNTTFGWYDINNKSNIGQIFSGSDDSNTGWKDANFSEKNFGFYIDPNGNQANRMYTEHLLNAGDQYQVAIFQINSSMYDYLLAWEDLSLMENTDQDYQDMIVRMKLNPVPEPATMLLLGSGLVAIAGFGRKKVLKKRGPDKS
jgi:hypothetical protein